MEEENKKLKIGTIAWHQYHIDRLKALRKESGSKAAKPRGAADKFGMRKEDYAEGYGNTNAEPRKQPQTRYRSRVEYDFLKYIRVAFKWAVENHETLTKSQIELLLYLYSLGAFSRQQFDDYHKLIGIYAVKTLKKFEDEGYIKVWRVGEDRKRAKLYTLTQKGKVLCNKMHRYCCGAEDIDLNPINNKMNRKDMPRINNYYMDMIKKMNSDRSDQE